MKQEFTEEDRRQLIAYRLEQSYEALDTAKDNIHDEHYNAAVNRIYYACFYALSALLLKSNISSTTHAGAKTLLGQHFIATGKIARKYSTFYGTIFNARNEGDYESFVYFDLETVEEYLEQAMAFVEVMEEKIREE